MKSIKSIKHCYSLKKYGYNLLAMITSYNPPCRRRRASLRRGVSPWCPQGIRWRRCRPRRNTSPRTPPAAGLPLPHCVRSSKPSLAVNGMEERKECEKRRKKMQKIYMPPPPEYSGNGEIRCGHVGPTDGRLGGWALLEPSACNNIHGKNTVDIGLVYQWNYFH